MDHARSTQETSRVITDSSHTAAARTMHKSSADPNGVPVSGWLKIFSAAIAVESSERALEYAF